jgi:hypothetical protein
MSISTDWFLLFLRLVFVAILFFFLYYVVRLTTRELTLLAQAEEKTPSARRARGHLVVIDPAGTPLPVGANLPLLPRSVVGRHPNCTIVLNDTFVSVEHAELEATGGGWLVRDLGSTNGTFVNGQLVAGTTSNVGDGDVIQFGRVKLRLVW